MKINKYESTVKKVGLSWRAYLRGQPLRQILSAELRIFTSKGEAQQALIAALDLKINELENRQDKLEEANKKFNTIKELLTADVEEKISDVYTKVYRLEG